MRCVSQRRQKSRRQSDRAKDMGDVAAETKSIKDARLEQQSSLTINEMQRGRPGWTRSEMT